MFCTFVCCGARLAMANGNARPSNRIQIRNVPAAVSKDEIDQLVATYGTVKKSNLGMQSGFIMFTFYYLV